MVQSTAQSQISMWDKCLRRIYGTPASVSIVTGKWKTGKTDFALHLAVDNLKNDMGLVHKVASNVKTFKPSRNRYSIEENEQVLYIDNFFDLDNWLFKSGRKCFIYDEAIKSTPSRRAMSSINTAWLKTIPELSKARTHLIVITQETDYTEKSFLHRTFVRAMWLKMSLPKGHPQFRKMVKLYANMDVVPVFTDVERTSVVFDPYRSAVFNLQPDITKLKLDEDVKIAFEFAEGLSSDKIVSKYDWIKTRAEALRHVRKGMSIVKNKYLSSS